MQQGTQNTPPAGPTSSLPECSAQRVVSIVAGNAGFGWFTQVWPAPEVISGYQPGFAFDDPKHAVAPLALSSAHPLWVRSIAGRAALDGHGAHPMPTAFVAGSNQTHTTTPNTLRLDNLDIVSAGAAAQSALGAKVAVLQISGAGLYMQAAGAPAGTQVANVDGAVSVTQQAANLSDADAAALKPDPQVVATWTLGNQRNNVIALAQNLLFAANAFKAGLVGTLLIPAMQDDPHGAFADPTSQTAVSDSIASILDRFYETLAQTNEPSCSHKGAPISLADNVLLVVTGDTPKNSFESAGWPDGTPGNSNFVYVRSNGFLAPGWFGNVSDNQTKTNFDPKTGALSGSATDQADQQAAVLGLLFAITRGNASLVSSVSTAEFGGTVASALP
jgi:hypothetical protein